MKRTFGHFEQPLPLLLDLGIPPLHLQQALQLAKMHFRLFAGGGNCLVEAVTSKDFW